jgi:hypothetical protein
VAATAAGRYRVVLSRLEREVASAATVLPAGEPAPIALPVPEGIEGVLRCTVFGPDGDPAAERLVFVRPAEAIRVELTAAAAPPVPGGRVELTVRTFEPNGEPVSAMAGLTVTGDAVLRMIEKRKQAPRLPVMAFLEPEVRQLEDARIYLSDDPLADRAVDLLLGTQGWRRFAFADPADFVARHGDAAKRVLALRLPAPPPPGAPMGRANDGGAPLPQNAPSEDDPDAVAPDGNRPAGPGEDAPRAEPAAKPEPAIGMARHFDEPAAGCWFRSRWGGRTGRCPSPSAAGRGPAATA